ncbi:MAG: hypothetical protein RR034_04445 [Bacteroidales bacterium]
MLRERDYVTTIEIVDQCKEILGFRITRRTIQLDMEAMKYDEFLAFFAPIEYDKSVRGYYYTEIPSYSWQYHNCGYEDLFFLTNLKQILKGVLDTEKYLQYCSIVDKIKKETLKID